MRVILASIVLLSGLIFSEVYSIKYFGEINTHHLLNLFPINVTFNKEDIINLRDSYKKSANFVYYKGNTSGIDQFNFELMSKKDFPELKQLLYSNHPESIKDDRIVYKNSKVLGASRIVFFHKNIADLNGFLVVKVNYLEASGTFSCMGGIGGPGPSELYVGQAIGKAYWENLQSNFVWGNGWEKTFYVKKNNIVGGILDVYPEQENSPYAVEIKFIREPTQSAPISLNILITDDYSVQTYPYSIVAKDLFIEDGAKIHNIIIGKDPVVQKGSDVLFGNYGIQHDYKVRIKEVGKYDIYFTANGGPARYVIKIDDKIYSGYANNDSIKITEINAFFPRLMFIQTFPLPGSNYPVTITIKKKS